MRTYTQLLGTSATTSPTTFGGAFTTLANNNSAQALATGQYLINNMHRYLLQKYFDNERTITFATVGSMNLTATAGISAGATSATLTASWTFVTCTQLVNFSDGEQQNVTFTNGSTAITWQVGLNNTVTNSIKTVGVQNYNIPANISKTKNVTVNIGQLKYQPIFIESIQDWDNMNFLPYTADIPNYVYIYNGTIRIFPIPSTTGNIVTINFKDRVIDMTFADYSAGTLANAGMVVGSTTVTGTSTLWSGTYPIGTNIQFLNLYFRADPATGGDGYWYPILQFNSATSLTLALPVVTAPSITTATTYTIGQMPLLQEDFHDLIVYLSLKEYFSTVVQNTDKYKQYDALCKDKLLMMEDYLGTKQVNVDLGGPLEQINPNFFLYAQN